MRLVAAALLAAFAAATIVDLRQCDVSKRPDPASVPIISVDSFRELDPHCAGQ